MFGSSRANTPVVENNNAVSLPRMTGSSIGGGSRRNGEAYNPDGIELIYVERVRTSSMAATSGFYIGKFEVTQEQWVFTI